MVPVFRIRQNGIRAWFLVSCPQSSNSLERVWLVETRSHMISVNPSRTPFKSLATRYKSPSRKYISGKQPILHVTTCSNLMFKHPTLNVVPVHTDIGINLVNTLNRPIPQLSEEFGLEGNCCQASTHLDMKKQLIPLPLNTYGNLINYPPPLHVIIHP